MIGESQVSGSALVYDSDHGIGPIEESAAGKIPDRTGDEGDVHSTLRNR